MTGILRITSETDTCNGSFENQFGTNQNISVNSTSHLCIVHHLQFLLICFQKNLCLIFNQLHQTLCTTKQNTVTRDKLLRLRYISCRIYFKKNLFASGGLHEKCFKFDNSIIVHPLRGLYIYGKIYP